MATRVRDFIARRGGKATTDELVGAFQNGVQGEQVVVFRRILKGVATFNKRLATRGNKGKWVLKKDFR